MVLRETRRLAQVHEQFSTSHKAHNKEYLLVGLEHVAHSYKERMFGLQQNVLFQFGRFNLVVLNNHIFS